MKKLLYALLAVVVLLVAAVLLVPSLVDWNAYKSELAAQVERVTGREVRILGNVELSMLPSPALNVERVALRNIEGGSRENMANLRALRVRIKLAPLLQGQIAVERIELVEPRILLERLADGRANWRFAGLADGEEPSEEAGGLAGQIRLDSFRIVDGTLIYRDAAAGIEQRLTGVDAELAAASLSGPFEASGQATARGVAIRFDGALGRLTGTGAAPYNVRLELPDRPARLSLSGAIEQNGPDGPAVRGSLRVRGDDLAATLARLTRSDARALPAQLAQRFLLAGDLRYAGGQLGAEALTLELGKLSAEGKLAVALDGRPDATLDLRVQRLSLDRLLGMRRPAAAGAGDGPEGTGLGAVPLPEGLRAELDVQVGAIVYRDRVVRQGRLNAVLADGEVTLNQATALLPGSSDIAVFGTLANRDGGAPVFDGRIEAASDNLRAVFDWLGVQVGNVPADRLRRLNLLADVSATPQQVTLTGIDLDVDTMQVNGGVRIALRKRPGFGIGLTFDKLNLDAYLPRPSVAEAAAQADAGGGVGASALDFLGGFDANFDLRAGRITYAGRTAREVKLDATLHNQALRIREASVADLAGTRASVAGEVRELVGLDPSFNLDVDLDVKSPRRLAQALGVGDPVPAGLDAMALVGTAKGSLSAVDLDTTVTAFGGTLTAKGTVEPLAAPARFDLVLEARHDSLADLARRVPGAPALAGQPGQLRLTGRLNGSTREFRTERLKGTIGPVDLQGPVAVDLTGPRPRIEAQLETGVLPVQAFALAGAGGSSDSGGADRDRGARWSSTPIPVAGLGALDGSLSLRTEAIRLAPDLRLEQARLSATLQDRVFDLEQLEAGFLDGRLRLSGTADARDTLAVSARVEARKVAAGAVVEQGFGYAGLEGPATLTADLTAKGASERALVESLTGDGALSGEITVRPQALLGAEAAALIGDTGAGPGKTSKPGGDLSAILGDALGAQVRISGVTDALDFVATSFADQPATLAGTFRAERGTLKTDDLRLDGQQGRARLDGSVNLPNWRMDLRTRLYRPGDSADQPFVVARQSGPVDRPNVKITGGAFREELKRGALEPEPAPAPDGAQAAEPSGTAAQDPADADSTAKAPPEPGSDAGTGTDGDAPADESAASEDGADGDAAADAAEPADGDAAAPESAAGQGGGAGKDGEADGRPSAEDIIRGFLETQEQGESQ